jgi:HTH-type transcriptional regulator/antitoxin HigA
MITNEKQYRITRSLLERLRLGLASAGARENLPDELVGMQRDALTSQIEELEEDIAVYDDLRSGRVTSFDAERLHELPDILIRARIARGMSQKDLAAFLGLKEQQIQRYEAERYRSASLDRLVEVSEALNVHIRNRAELVGDGRLASVDPAVWQTFPIAEMYKRGWFEDFSGTMAQARKAAIDLVPAFLQGSGGRHAPAALHRKSVRASGQVHEASIAAWEARVRQLAERDPPGKEFSPELIDDAWVAGLVALTLDPDGPAKAIPYLRAIGISLIVEPQLPGTLLDGAALCTFGSHAIIALTLRHDRLDNFWFTLLHELGHLKRHIGDAGYSAIFDDTETPASDDIEREADAFALEALLPVAKWNLAVARFTRTEKAVNGDAKRFGVGPAIIAGRVRREAGDYTILRGLVGAGEVRRQFGM